MHCNLPLLDGQRFFYHCLEICRLHCHDAIVVSQNYIAFTYGPAAEQHWLANRLYGDLADDITRSDTARKGGKLHIAQLVRIPHRPLHQSTDVAAPTRHGGSPFPKYPLVMRRLGDLNHYDRTGHLRLFIGLRDP